MEKKDREFNLSRFETYINDRKFKNSFYEFIDILLQQDLSEKTLEYLFEIFLKDTDIYFED